MKIKISQNKERNTIAKQSQLSSLNSSMIKINKQQSKHTKLSTNLTSQSLHNNAPSKKNIKDKKIDIQINEKRNKILKQKDQVISGRAKKLKDKIKNKKSCDFQRQKYFISQKQAPISFREYCLVENSFVPVTSNIQTKRIQDMMRSTADTTHRFQDFNRTTFRKVFPFKLKNSNSSVSEISQNSQIMFKNTKHISRRQVQIQAFPFCEQVGIQYSERPQLKQNEVQSDQQQKGIQIDIQTDQIMTQSPVKFLDCFSPQKQKQDQSLSDLLLKLQFKHLPNQKSFQNLSKNQKEHYSGLLSSLISKLNCSPRQIEKSPIKTKEMIEIQEVRLIPLEQIKIKYQKLEMQIFKRQSFQMNWMQKRPYLSQNKASIDTSLISVSSFLLNFFCYIELNHLEQFLTNIKKLYGPSYFYEFQRITKGNIGKPTKFYILDETIFQEFCQEVNRVSEYERIHYKAVFDFINSLLDCYRPYYQHNGEPFPWALKVYQSICEYVIDQSSLQIIFIELKQNIEKSVSLLCGLLVDEKLIEGIEEVNPLTLKRSQKQNILIQQWLTQKTDENHEVQCQSTKVLHQLSEEIYNSLLIEILQQKPFSKN